MNDFHIDPEFAALIPPPQAEEVRLLEEVLVREGCRDALVVWAGHGILLDGHRRLTICRQHGIPFEVREIKLESRQAARIWVRDNQMSRRNLNDAQKIDLQLANKDDLLVLGREKQREGGKRGGRGREKVLSPGDNTYSNPKHDTRGQVARAAGVSTGSVAMAEVVRREAPELWEQCKAGELAIKAAYTQVKRPHVAHNTGNNEWYTPPEYLKAARAVMGGIDTDPASTEQANRTVRAKVFYTAGQDGLKQKWSGCVWLNPPYSQPLCSRFCESVAERFDSGEIKQAIVLVNNATDTAFFQRMLQSASAVCFPKGRVRFLDTDGNPGAPLQGQAVLYFGPRVSLFTKTFQKFGGVCHVAR